MGSKKNRLFVLGLIMAAMAAGLAFKAAPAARANIDPFGSMFCLLPLPGGTPGQTFCEAPSGQLNIVKSILNPHSVGSTGYPEYRIGDLVQYVITVGNSSGSAINFGQVKDVYPPELAYTPNTNDPGARPSPIYNPPLTGFDSDGNVLPSGNPSNHLLRYWFASEADNPPGSNCDPDSPCLINYPCEPGLSSNIKLCYSNAPLSHEIAISANGPAGITIPASKTLYIGLSFLVNP